VAGQGKAGQNAAGRSKPGHAPELVTHKAVAKRIGVTTETLRRWVRLGVWPRPHAIVANTWLFESWRIDHYVASGKWPHDTKFRGYNGG
jgi:hypothetical protein